MCEHSASNQLGAGFADVRVSTFLRHIKMKYPSLFIESVRTESGGQRSDVVVINNTTVFRFPRTTEGLDSLSTEVSILRTIRGRVALPTPDPTYDNLATRTVGTTFIGYPRLSGEPLRRDLLSALDDTTRFALAVQLARFLETLHNLPCAVRPGDLPVQDGHDHWADLYSRIRDKLFPLMGLQGRASVANHFEGYLAEPGNSLYQPVLRHGDFGPTNILFDSVLRTVSGIVDFGSAGVGDPALDLAGLMGPFGYGETFVQSIAESYSATWSFLRRARFYAGTFALQEALWGLEHGDREAFDSGIAAYR